MTKKILLTLLMGLPLTSYGGGRGYNAASTAQSAAGTQAVVAAPIQSAVNEAVQINTQTNPPLRLQDAQPTQNQDEQKAESTMSQIKEDLLKLSGILNQLEESRIMFINIAERLNQIISSGKIEQSANEAVAVQQETLKEAIKSITDEDADAQQAAKEEIEKALLAQNEHAEEGKDDLSAQHEQISAPNTVPTNIMEDAAKQSVSVAAQQAAQELGKSLLDEAPKGIDDPLLAQDNNGEGSKIKKENDALSSCTMIKRRERIKKDKRREEGNIIENNNTVGAKDKIDGESVVSRRHKINKIIRSIMSAVNPDNKTN